ncbi:MAG: hypothetical protein ACT4PW_07065 [Acidimicrobiia bacterium]
MSRLQGLLRLRGFQKGVMGQSRAWMTLWLALSAREWLRNRARKREVVARYTLGPGEGLSVSDLGLTAKQAPPP